MDPLNQNQDKAQPTPRGEIPTKNPIVNQPLLLGGPQSTPLESQANVQNVPGVGNINMYDLKKLLAHLEGGKISVTVQSPFHSQPLSERPSFLQDT